MRKNLKSIIDIIQPNSMLFLMTQSYGIIGLREFLIHLLHLFQTHSPAVIPYTKNHSVTHLAGRDDNLPFLLRSHPGKPMLKGILHNRLKQKARNYDLPKLLRDMNPQLHAVSIPALLQVHVIDHMLQFLPQRKFCARHGVIADHLGKVANVIRRFKLSVQSQLSGKHVQGVVDKVRIDLKQKSL